MIKIKSTGIIRRVDDLGRIVIPREVRKRLLIKDGDPMELFVEGTNLIFRKYYPEDSIIGSLQVIIEQLDAKDPVYYDDCFENGRKEFVKTEIEKLIKKIEERKEA